MIDISRKTLKNGILILAEKRPNVEGMVSIHVGVKAGSIHEGPKDSGILHLVEHLAFKGQSKRNFEKVIKGFEHNGFSFQAGTSPNVTEFSAEGPCKDLPLAIEELYRAVTNARYDLAELKSEKEQIFGEILARKDELWDYCEDKLLQLLYRGSSFEKPILGTPKSIKKLSRRKLVQFKKAYFRPNNMVIGISGKFDEKELFRAVKNTFGRLKSREISFSEIKNPNPASRRRVSILKKRKGTRSAYLCLGYLLPGFDQADAPKLLLLHSILGDGIGKSSKFYLKLMQKYGLGYQFKGEIGNLGEFAVLFFVFQIAKPQRFLEARRVIFEEIKKMRTEALEDLEGYKNWFISRFKKEVLADIHERAKRILESEMEGWQFDFRRLPEIISRITPQEIQEAARKYLTDKRTMFAVVPWGFRIRKYHRQ